MTTQRVGVGTFPIAEVESLKYSVPGPSFTSVWPMVESSFAVTENLLPSATLTMPVPLS